jgi:hypothetical protein
VIRFYCKGVLFSRGSSGRGYRLLSAAMINITHGARKNNAAKEFKSKSNQQNAGLSQNNNFSTGAPYQQKPYSGNQNKAHNSYADAFRGGQGSYSDLKNRNDYRRYDNDYGYHADDFGYNDHGRGQRGSFRQGSYDGRGHPGDYQANIDYDGYNGRGYYSESPRGKGGFNSSDRGRRNQTGSRDTRQQQKEEIGRENQLKSQQNKSQASTNREGEPAKVSAEQVSSKYK